MSAPAQGVAVIGLGVIGSAMARRLIAAGLDVAVFNRSTYRVKPFEAERCRIALSPADALARSSLAIVAVSDDAAVEDVVLGSDGLAEASGAGTLIVNCSTVHPSTDRSVAERLALRAVGYMDAPVTGGAEAAKSGTLTLLCGASRADFEHARPVLEHVGRRVLHMGPVGAGQLTKAVNQVILAGSLLGVAEGMVMAQAVGLDLDRVIDALREGAAASWVLSNRASFMARRDFPPVGRLALHLKDLNIALSSASEAGVSLRGAQLVRDLERRLADAGRADADVSALLLACEGSE